jgi:hypothetical protein
VNCCWPDDYCCFSSGREIEWEQKGAQSGFGRATLRCGTTTNNDNGNKATQSRKNRKEQSKVRGREVKYEAVNRVSRSRFGKGGGEVL